jgi:NAD(P)-dependent dehydrogenase (short-subunit alcohol dehydrogenase family)
VCHAGGAPLLSGKVVLVSGGTRGVGAGVARAAAREGAAVAVTGRRREPGDALVGELEAAGTEALFIRTDVADPAQVLASVDAVLAEHGRVDCLVNAAGLTSRGTLLDTTPELFDAHIAVNLRGPFFLMQAVVRSLVDRGAPGSIVNVISSSELGGQPYLAPYVAAKAGLAGLTRNAAYAHRFDRIRINGVDIGWTDTEGEDVTQRAFHDADDSWRERAARTLPMGKLGQVDEIADFVVFLLSDRSGVVTGSVLDWDQNVFGAHDWNRHRPSALDSGAAGRPGCSSGWRRRPSPSWCGRRWRRAGEMFVKELHAHADRRA